MKVPDKTAVEAVLRDHIPQNQHYIIASAANAFLTNLEVPTFVFERQDRKALEEIRKSISTLTASLAIISDGLQSRINGEILCDIIGPSIGQRADLEAFAAQLEFLGRVVNNQNWVEAPPKPKRSDLNKSGLQVVNAARFAWHTVFGGEPPSAGLRDGDKFALFLSDLLVLTEVEGDARSIFAAWALWKDDFS